MKIDGYTPPSKEIGIETGVEFEYDSKYGKFHYRGKFAGDMNTGFQKAIAQHNKRMALRAKTGAESNPEAEYKELLGIWHDHVVASWATSVKSGGQEIKPTRENFIALLSELPFRPWFQMIVEDCTNFELFAAEVVEEAAKN